MFGKQLSRETGSRVALFRGLVSALVEHGSIETTEAKARAILPDIDHLVNLAKDDSITSHRRVFANLGNNKKATRKLLEISKMMGGRPGGFTRIVKLGRRKGDGAEMVRMEWVDQVGVVKDSNRAKSTKSKNNKEVAKKK